MASKRSLPGFHVAVFVASLMACGGGANSGASSAGGADASTNSDAGRPSSSSGGSSSGTSGGGGPAGTPAPARCTAAPGDYEGVDTSKVPTGSPPVGCEKGYDAHTHALTITMASGSTASIAANKSGQITVDGVVCTTAQGAPAMAALASTVVVKGTPGDETVIVDLADGALSHVEIDLQGGTDTFVVKGSTRPDAIRAGSSNAGAVFDWSGDLLADATVAGVENFTVSMGPGDDVFRADGAKNLGDPAAVAFTAYGGAGNDTLEGGAKSDALCGGGGNDTLLADSGPSGDQFEGGDGVDTADFSARIHSVAVTLDDVADDGEQGESADVRKSIENLNGGAGDDVLVGTAAGNILSGNGGNDTITGGDGNDVLSGGDGDDSFDEDAAPNGGDIIDGGNGSDLVLYEKRSDAVSVILCTQTTASACPASSGETKEGDTLVNVENASGGSGDDTFIGNAFSNSFYGGAGNDTMEGNDGDDYLYGDDGADILHGGNGDDYLDGARDFDVFNGGPGQGDICIIEKEKGEIPTACELF